MKLEAITIPVLWILKNVMSYGQALEDSKIQRKYLKLGGTLDREQCYFRYILYLYSGS